MKIVTIKEEYRNVFKCNDFLVVVTKLKKGFLKYGIVPYPCLVVSNKFNVFFVLGKTGSTNNKKIVTVFIPILLCQVT